MFCVERNVGPDFWVQEQCFLGPEEDLSIQFNPDIEPGQTVNIVFRGFNPQSSICQWSTELLADCEDPVRFVGPTFRLNVYEQDPYR